MICIFHIFASVCDTLDCYHFKLLLYLSHAHPCLLLRTQHQHLWYPIQNNKNFLPGFQSLPHRCSTTFLWLCILTFFLYRSHWFFTRILRSFDMETFSHFFSEYVSFSLGVDIGWSCTTFAIFIVRAWYSFYAWENLVIE